MMTYFNNKIGLEIGGPSGIFEWKGLPIYAAAARIDNCNFARQTIWEGAIQEGSTFCFSQQRPPGTQFIAEATNLNQIAPGSYDFVLSSHILEHVANPLKALSEFTRVLKENGALVVIVPHKDGTFDHLRPVTTLEHLIRDFEENVTEGDMTHLEEILRLHDLSKDPAAGNHEVFRERSIRNLENRCLHHHVFNTPLAIETIHHMGLKLVEVAALLPYHILIIAEKPAQGQAVQNERFRRVTSEPCWSSPFPSDQRHEAVSGSRQAS